MPPSGLQISPAPAVAPPPAEGEAPAHATPAFLQALCAEVSAGLQGVLALTELLQAQPDGADGPAYVRTIADCSRTLLRVLSDAVELSSGEAEGRALTPEPTRLRDLLDAVQTDWAARAAEDGVGLGAAYVGEAGLLAELDGGRLREVYNLLIGHALKLTRRGGVEVSLHAEREGERVRLRGCVRDTGPGVDPAQLPSFFEPFGPSARAPYGTGLDLALARSAVQALGGRIWTENNAGAGAAVTFQFDARACEAAPDLVAETAEPDPGPPLAGHVLIVDDNATNQLVARALVEMFGCTCETADDGVEALDVVVQGRFDAVLMDIRMPRMDGVAATRAIRALAAPVGRIPIIALTANADPEDVAAYLESGMASLVEKPIRSERLLLALSEALGTRTGDARQAAA